jgi:2-hydroxy-3-oxopropionate reductase
MTKPRLAFLGIGLMGAPMARNLLKAGFSVRVWNRTRAKAEAMAPLGAKVVATAADAAAEANIVITMLDNGAVVETVLLGSGGIAEALATGSLVIDMSSIEPARARGIADRLRERGIGCLDAPVSGGTIGAEQASLAIMVGGEATDFARAEPVFAALGRATHVGAVGSGQLAKLCNQAIVATTVAVVAEALLLAAAAGIDPGAVRAALKGGSADSKILQIQGGRMLDRDFLPTGTTRIVHKDCANVLAEAKALGLSLPVSERVTELFCRAMEHGKADLDHIAVLLELEAMNPGKRLGSKTDRLPE